MFGLDISDASIEALELKKSFGRIRLVGYARVELPAGIVEDGIVLKKKELGEVVKKLLRSAKPKAIRSREVILSLPESRVFTYIFKFPANLKIKQIAEVLKFEAPNVLPISPEEVYSDFLILDKVNREQEIFYVAAPKKAVDDLGRVMKDIGLTPLAFDMESTSFARAVGMAGETGSMIIDIGARTTIISVFDQNGIRFTTNIGVAGNAFTEAIAKKLKKKWEEAEELKKTCGLTPKDGPCKGGQIFLIVQAALQPILGEIKSTLKFYEEKSGRKIQKIILCGGSSLLPYLPDYLKENLGLEVEVGKPYLVARGMKIPKAEITPLLLNVFGLALRGTVRAPERAGINLMFELEKISRFKKKGLSKKKILIWLVLLGLILVGGASYFYLKPKILPLVFFGIRPERVSLAFNLKIAVSGKPGPVAGRAIEVEKEGSKVSRATGRKVIEGRASGKVKIINNSLTTQTMVATTRLLSEGGVLFRLKNKVTVRGGEAIEAEVYADLVGAAGDIGAGKFTVPGLSPSLQKLIFAQSDAPMTGGAVETSFVSEEDIEKAKKEFAAELAAEAKNKEATSRARPGEILLPVVLAKEVLAATSDAVLGDAVSEFNLRMKIKIKFLVVSENDLEKFMRDELVKKDVQRPGVYEFQNLEYSLINFNEASGEATVKVGAQAVNM